MGLKLKTNEIAQLLDRSARQIDRETLQNLQAARRIALQHQRTKHTTTVMAWIDQHGLLHHHGPHSHKAFNLGLAALLAALLLSVALYVHNSYEHDHSDIDIQILTDDLPVDMYVD